jgi:hypothetical protein
VLKDKLNNIHVPQPSVISVMLYSLPYKKRKQETLPGIPEITEEMPFPENDQQTQLVPSKMYWTTFCAEKNLLVLTKLLYDRFLFS